MTDERKRRKDLILQEKVRSGLDGDRKVFSISLMYDTWRLVNRLVETGPGKYGSSLIDHAIRFFIACLTGDAHNIEVAISEIEPFVIAPDFSDNLRKIASTWDERKGDIDL